MTYVPAPPSPIGARPIITLPFDAAHCPLGNLYAIQKRALASGTWTTATTATYFEFYIYETTTIYKIGWINGSAGTGNICVAIYNSSLVRQVTTGDVTRSGASVTQWSDIADTVLVPGTYHLGVNHTLTTANQCFGDAAANHSLEGSLLENVRQQAVGAIALPDPAVPATLSVVRFHQIIFLSTVPGVS